MTARTVARVVVGREQEERLLTDLLAYLDQVPRPHREAVEGTLALRAARAAELLDMDQSEVSRLEHRSDMLLSTLKRFVHATGEMHIVVSYPTAGPSSFSSVTIPNPHAVELERVLARVTERVSPDYRSDCSDW